ncbi:LicD family protein [Cnuella takakiae]|nr:LicD family protein [Cnuella takakiae]OLY90851.1 hypothetical protein BUE76_02280 [Cnuella takakiae]
MNFETLFPDNRASGETTLRQCQLVMLRMLKVFDHLCTRHNIEYFLIGGTLLGAIRHKGFIPWDDDLDVGMTREAYEKFLRLAVAELPNDIFFQNTQTDKYYKHGVNVDARLRDKFSSYRHLTRPSEPWHQGLQVDIFVHDRAFVKNDYGTVIINKIANKVLGGRKRAQILNAISRWSPLDMVYNSNYMQEWVQAGQGTYITNQELSKLIRWPFEDMNALIPADYHTYLSRQFGNYMQLPPEEKRVSNHNVIADPFTPCQHPEVLTWPKSIQTPAATG